ncbi:LysM peptidoglycan-binding domain-containing protein [Paenactinomyces guangxiensis]|uniref:LysM peptidoglycan-binding domain-containing protein n=1 Tax=Paenactinomyces guangxiensis TaxID=1490290 RepID=A0A7W1WUE5_9BACL|nr:LysM peptidoglycan-binding domain-containing protein [Paenactinomyces guangxiensis]MBA4496137.1 LysM peptidoglycan-binding domain-containing protein [Paenactinomyces guangxiensis]MBH8593225.1 LysM peptidoglycan-binding domain-containing protein [Paenactinomyces guangxiensis]
MENQFNQLRFDISEKVRLNPQQPGIGTLLELDLYPDVEIRDEGQHLKIQGYLRLNGAYLGEQADSSREDVHLHLDDDPEEANRQEIAYVIPVEITLPADRAELDHISAEVETFDYSVLSPFELQIEAILMIDGLLPEKKPEDVSEIEEVQAEVPVFSGSPAQPLAVSSMGENREEQEEHREEAKMEPPPATPHPEQQDSVHKQEAEELQPEEQDERRELKVVEDEEHVEGPQLDFRSRKSADEQHPAPVFKPQTAHDFWAERQERKKDSSEYLRQEAEDQAEEEKARHEQMEDETEQTEKKQGTDWASWLVGNKEDHFASMRMVIVQKDESIDHLAGKYQITADEIIRLNKLQTDRLQEGQIIYIPCRQREETSEDIRG